MAINIRPLGDRVLIEPITEAEKTKAGIYLPDTASKERPEQGKVVAVGKGKIDRNGKLRAVGELLGSPLKAGHKVLFTKYGPNEIKVGGKEYLIAKEEDIIAIIE